MSLVTFWSKSISCAGDVSFPSGESVEVPELRRRSKRAHAAAKMMARRDRVAKYLVAMVAVLGEGAVGCIAVVLQMLQLLQSVVDEIERERFKEEVEVIFYRGMLCGI